MEITNEERREVAARLHGLSEVTSTLSYTCSKQEYDAMVLRAIRAVVGEGDVFHLLADLIDRPTCKPKERYTGYVDAVCDSFCCPKCGFEIDVHIGEEQHQTETAKYCPNCGEGVTDED